MTTPQDLLFVVLDVRADRPVERGDLSLALAGAELLDLLGAGVAELREDLIVPTSGHLTGDRLLDEAAAALVREEPYEPVRDWLWRRGDGLAATYTDALEPGGSGLRHLFRRPEPADSAERRQAAERWAVREPVLTGLAAELGIGEPGVKGGTEENPEDDRVALVLATVGEALTELEAVRQRRRIEEDAFDNVWRAP
ncbi:GPP34 family phosphoprotein [Streptomyces sp. NPDC003656]|uniref:GPP34 family phosphoprotein n=1 Tax=unclassified Streptomyces TaxID=2593676 RepID=UPI0018F2FEAB|nr:GPP34 family phosphoprotein [Streptomyces sp. DSM 110735]MBJ7904730.1 GPP34 family phosphoprotein [Streptomyces sp. DSM 110735]